MKRPVAVVAALVAALPACRAAAAAAGTSPPPSVVLEAERAAFRGGGVEARPGASGGKLLGDGWGGARTHEAAWRFTLPAEIRDASLAVRYSYDAEHYARRFRKTAKSHTLRVMLDGREVAQARYPDTSDWGVFANVRVPLGRVASGEHTLRLAPDADGNDINLDHAAVTCAATDLDTRTATSLPGRSRHFRIRLSPRVDTKTFPAMQTFAFLEAQRAFLRDLLGFEPPHKADDGLLTVIAPDDWPAPGATAYSSQGIVYLQQREIGEPNKNYAHELFHTFEAGMGYPTWWSEGMAYLVSLRSDKELYGRPQADIDKELADLRAWWETEGRNTLLRDGENQLTRWGSGTPPDVSNGTLYRAANAAAVELWRRGGGDEFLRRVYAAIRSDRAAGRYEIASAVPGEKHRLLRGYLDRAAARPGVLDAFWKEWGL